MSEGAFFCESLQILKSQEVCKRVDYFVLDLL